ncbi:MAG TPA: FemAB family XrtA/PEP-CTERM system-associated protein [Steroidobacteraceae bacterium]|nr:FemAB family XrtA/PEP-CTERM system-associated protein [Steroidobacteraceae bacterium]
MAVEVTPAPPPEWDKYVSGHPAATAYHRAAAVRIGADAFGLRTFFLAAHGQQGLRGVLPLVEQSSLLFGRFLVSVPFFTYGGVLADDPAIALQLAQRAAQIARERRAAHVELRHSAPMPDLALPERLDKVSLVLQLPATAEELAKRLGSKLRSQVKRAEREAPEIVWGRRELIPEFYEVFASSMHELGTPVYPRRFFEVVCEAFADLLEVLVVRRAGVVEAAAITIRHGQRVEVPWGAATDAGKRASLNMRMYWEVLKRSVESGAGQFDFGRSTVDSGTYRFKTQWGAVPQQLHWHYCLAPGSALPQLNQSNPKYAKAAAIWRSMPLWCANLIGPRISRHLPW